MQERFVETVVRLARLYASSVSPGEVGEDYEWLVKNLGEMIKQHEESERKAVLMTKLREDTRAHLRSMIEAFDRVRLNKQTRGTFEAIKNEAGRCGLI